MKHATLSRHLGFALVLAGGLAMSSVAMASNHARQNAAQNQAPVVRIAPTPVAVANRAITEADVQAAQRAWGEALVRISREFERGGLPAATAAANAALDAAFGYQMGPVLFKPTLTTAPHTFRTTREGALAYFVGNNPSFPADSGFALKGWRSAEIRNVAIQLLGDTAISMGNVVLTDRNGRVTTVDKTWGYVRDDQGNLRIVLHHSSLPVSG